MLKSEAINRNILTSRVKKANDFTLIQSYEELLFKMDILFLNVIMNIYILTEILSIYSI